MWYRGLCVGIGANPTHYTASELPVPNSQFSSPVLMDSVLDFFSAGVQFLPLPRERHYIWNTLGLNRRREETREKTRRDITFSPCGPSARSVKTMGTCFSVRGCFVFSAVVSPCVFRPPALVGGGASVRVVSEVLMRGQQMRDRSTLRCCLFLLCCVQCVLFFCCSFLLDFSGHEAIAPQNVCCAY